jgi:GntR family transcriptional regulator
VAGWLNVDPRGGMPMYLQIVEQTGQALGVGVLRPGDRMPAVR